MGKTRKALVTGINGQDGWYLSRLLRSKGYEVHGLAHRRGSSADSTDEVRHIGSVTDVKSLLRLLRAVRPDEVYNLGALSRVRLSFAKPVASR